MNLRYVILILILVPMLGGVAWARSVSLAAQNCRLEVPDGFESSSPEDPHIVYSAKLKGPGLSEQVVSIYTTKSTLTADNPVVVTEIQAFCDSKQLEVLAHKTTLINGRKFLVTNVISRQNQIAGVLFTTTTGNSLVTLIFLKFPSTDQSMDVDLDAIAMANSLRLITPLVSEKGLSYYMPSGTTMVFIALGLYVGFIFMRYFVGLFSN